MLIDTPGLREVQLWGGEQSLLESLIDIRELNTGCRFRDCRHQGEPVCAVQRAVAEGALPLQRIEHCLEQRDELVEVETHRRLSAVARSRPCPCYDLQLDTRDIANSATDTSTIMNRNAGR